MCNKKARIFHWHLQTMVCVICQEDINSTQSKHVTNCAHTFHDSCWCQYIQHQQATILCPICKTEQANTTITLVIASSHSVSYDNSIEHEFDNAESKNVCSISKHCFLIICLVTVLLVISIACILTMLE